MSTLTTLLVASSLQYQSDSVKYLVSSVKSFESPLSSSHAKKLTLVGAFLKAGESPLKRIFQLQFGGHGPAAAQDRLWQPPSGSRQFIRRLMVFGSTHQVFGQKDDSTSSFAQSMLLSWSTSSDLKYFHQSGLPMSIVPMQLDMVLSVQTSILTQIGLVSLGRRTPMSLKLFLALMFLTCQIEALKQPTSPSQSSPTYSCVERSVRLLDKSDIVLPTKLAALTTAVFYPHLLCVVFAIMLYIYHTNIGWLQAIICTLE